MRHYKDKLERRNTIGWTSRTAVQLRRSATQSEIVFRIKLLDAGFFKFRFQKWWILENDIFITDFFIWKKGIVIEVDGRNEETGKREIFKSGIKMKAETETAFEPDILVLMQKVQDLISEEKSVWRQAMVVKDRTTQIDGKTFKNPTFEDFYPAIKVLLDGTLREVHGNQIPDTFAEFENKYSEVAKDREILVAEIEGTFSLMGLGTGAKDKQVKSWALNQVYGVNSIEALGKKNNTAIREGLLTIKGFGNKYKDYMNECLDKEVEMDSKHLAKLMKELIQEPVK